MKMKVEQFVRADGKTCDGHDYQGVNRKRPRCNNNSGKCQAVNVHIKCLRCKLSRWVTTSRWGAIKRNQKKGIRGMTVDQHLK